MAALPENDRIAGPFIAIVGQTDFPADFPLINAGGLRVRRERAGVATVLSGAAVTPVAPSDGGFTARLASPAQDGDRYWVYSELAAARLRQHTPNGAVRSVTLEDDATELQAQLQEHRRDLGRALTVPPGVAGSEAPWRPGDGDRFLVIGADGRLKAVDRPQDFTALDKASVRLDNLAPGAADMLPVTAGLAGAVPQTLALLAGLTVTPELFGAVSGTVSTFQAIANTVALRNAANSGYAVFGNGRTYSIYGELRPITAARFFWFAIRQMSPDTGLEKTLLLDGVNVGEIVLDHIIVDENNLMKTAGMGQASAIQISQCSAKVRLLNVYVVRGGAITGIKLDQLSDVQVIGGGVRDFAPSFASMPDDDVCQAYSIGQCSNFYIDGYDIKNLVAQYPGRASNAQQWSRGIAIGNCIGGFVGKGRIGNVDQGVDVSGASNDDITVDGPFIYDVGTHGLKAANTFRNIVFQNFTVLRPGADGVAISAPGSTGVVQPSRAVVRNGTIKNPGSNGFLPPSSDAFGPRGAVGIKVSGRSVAQAGYPEGVCIYGMRIIDDQAVKTMVWGIDVNMATAGPDQAFPALINRLPIQEWDNIIEGAIAGRQRGCQYHRCALAGTGALSIPNNAWTPVPFTATDVDDTAALHDPAGANPSYVIVREDGVYAASAVFTHDNTATGQRGVRLRVNGGSAVYGSMQISAQTAFSPQVATAPASIPLKSGDRIEVEVFQNSGAPISNSLSNAIFNLVMIQRGS